MMSIMLPLHSFVHFFAEQILIVDKIYNWPIKRRTKETLPDFPWHEWEKQSGGARECIALKKYLTQVWNTSDEVDKKALARWIVADWGGVRSNRAATFDAHWQLIQLDVKQMPLQGIASYSKILTLKDCTQYAIYDARVAACLNAVQLQMKPEQPVFFHIYLARTSTFASGRKEKTS